MFCRLFSGWFLESIYTYVYKLCAHVQKKRRLQKVCKRLFNQFVVLSGLEPELFWSRNRRVANYTTGQFYGWPVKARTWTLLDQNQTCCQLHHGSINNVLLFKTAAKVRSFFCLQTDMSIKMVSIDIFVVLHLIPFSKIIKIVLQVNRNKRNKNPPD